MQISRDRLKYVFEVFERMGRVLADDVTQSEFDYCVQQGWVEPVIQVAAEAWLTIEGKDHTPPAGASHAYPQLTPSGRRKLEELRKGG